MHTTEIVLEATAGGSQAVWEWPHGNQGWKMLEVIKFWGSLPEYEDVILHGCPYGLRELAGDYIKKPWRLRTTSRTTADAWTAMPWKSCSRQSDWQCSKLEGRRLVHPGVVSSCGYVSPEVLR